jgi:hypothetical protein
MGGFSLVVVLVVATGVWCVLDDDCATTVVVDVVVVEVDER